MPVKRRQQDTGDKRDVRDVTGAVLATGACADLAPYTHQGLVSVAEYRALMSDFVSSDAIIIMRLDHIEALCRTVVRARFERLSASPYVP
jgi:hypothetical protein